MLSVLTSSLCYKPEAVASNIEAVSGVHLLTLQSCPSLLEALVAIAHTDAEL